MITLRLNLPAIEVDGRRFTMGEYLQFLADRSPIFSKDLVAVRKSMQLTELLTSAKSIPKLAIPYDLHRLLIEAASHGPYPIYPARNLMPFIDEILEPQSEKPNGAETISRDSAPVSD